MFSGKDLYGFAIRSVEVKTDYNGKFMVVYWSPLIRDYWSTEKLSKIGAEQMALAIQARLALDWGAPSFTN